MNFTNLMLVDFALKALAKGAKYWYGTFGLKATTSLYNSKKAQYPSHYTASRAPTYKQHIADGKWVTDCMGLIKWFFWSKNGEQATKYADGFPDISANQCIANYCEKTGPISTLPNTSGLVLWTDGHIGVYIGDGWAVEARGFAYGVVKTRVSERSWRKWGKIKSKYMTFVDGSIPVPEPETFGSRELKLTTPITKGEDVKQLQKLLINWEYSCGKWGADGEFGAATESAVVAWQYDNGLPETGVVDADDYAKVTELLNPEDEDGDDGSEDQDAPHGYVTVTSGNTVNVRTEPNGNAPKLGIAYLGNSFEYLGEDSANGWHRIQFGSSAGWITGEYTTVVSDVAPPPVTPPSTPEQDAKAVIVDISQHNSLKHAKNDWAKIAKNVDLLILRCGVTRTETAPIGIGIDAEFAYAAKQCQAHGIPFGVFYYGKVKTADEARREARKSYATASPYKPMFYCYDVEEGRLTNACLQAFADELRKLGEKKVGIYVGHNYYTTFKASIKHFDFVWIPRYGKNTGEYDKKYAPAYACDIHQYTSLGDGKALGFYDNSVDLNRLIGSKPLSWFLES